MLLTMKNLKPGAGGPAAPGGAAAAAAAAPAGGGKRGAGGLHIPPMTPTAAVLTGRRTAGAGSGGGRKKKGGAGAAQAQAGPLGMGMMAAPVLPMPPPGLGLPPMGPPVPGMPLGLGLMGSGSSVGSNQGSGGGGGGGGGGHKRKRSATPSDLCQRCLVEGLQRGITHWHKDASRSTGGICKDHAFELHKKDPVGFGNAYRMRHGRACERCGILRRATHGYIGEGVSRFCGECAGAARGCIDLNNFKCKIQSCNRMARFVGFEHDRGLIFRCWAHKAPDMKEAGDQWRAFYADYYAKAQANGGPPLLDQDPATGQLLAVPMALPPPPPPMPLPGQHNPLLHGHGLGPPLPLPVPVPLVALSGDAEGLAVDRAGGSFAPSPTGSSANDNAAGPAAASVKASGNQAKRQRKQAISPMAQRSGGKRKAAAEESEEEEEEEMSEEEEEDEVEMSDQEEDGGDNGNGESKEGATAEAGPGEEEGQGQQPPLQHHEGQEEVPPPAINGALPHPPTESLNI